VAVDQQAHHLAFGDAEAERLQLRGQSLHGHLPMVVLGEYEAAQLRTEMSSDTGWERRQHRMPVRRRPAFAAIADHPGVQDQLLHDERLIALEA